jgi:hypothetical protein
MTALDLVEAVAIEKDVYGKSAWSGEQFKEEFAKVPKSAHYLVAEFAGRLMHMAVFFTHQMLLISIH